MVRQEDAKSNSDKGVYVEYEDAELEDLADDSEYPMMIRK